MCGCLSHDPLLGTWPTAQACALTGNQTSDPFIHRLALNRLSHITQGDFLNLFLMLGPLLIYSLSVINYLKMLIWI